MVNLFSSRTHHIHILPRFCNESAWHLIYHRLQTRLRQQAESLQTGKECVYHELRFRRGSSLAYSVMGIACSSSDSDQCWCPYYNVCELESYISDRLTFSKICGRSSHRIYRMALSLVSPETLSSLSKLRIF